MEPPSHWYVEESILQIQSASPHRLHYTKGDELDGLHLELRDNQVFVQPGEVQHWAKRAIFLGDEKETGEEERTRMDDLLYNAPGKKVGEEPPDGR